MKEKDFKQEKDEKDEVQAAIEENACCEELVDFDDDLLTVNIPAHDVE